jgi:hypothetical protein
MPWSPRASATYRRQGASIARRVAPRFGPLRSELDTEIHPQDSGCDLVRRQCDPGLIGRIFTLIAGRREASEAGEYVRVWARYAEGAAM